MTYKMWSDKVSFEYWTDGTNVVVRDMKELVFRRLESDQDHPDMVPVDDVPDDVKSALKQSDRFTDVKGLEGKYGVRVWGDAVIFRGQPGYTQAVKIGDNITVQPDDMIQEEDKIWAPSFTCNLSSYIFKLRLNHLYSVDDFFIGYLERYTDNNLVELNRCGKVTSHHISTIRPVTGHVRSVDTGDLIDYVHGMRTTDIIGHRSVIFGDLIRTVFSDGVATYRVHLSETPQKLEKNEFREPLYYLVNDDETVNRNIVRLKGNLGLNLETGMPCLFEGAMCEVNRREFKKRYFNPPMNMTQADIVSELCKMPSDEVVHIFNTVVMKRRGS